MVDDAADHTERSRRKNPPLRRNQRWPNGVERLLDSSVDQSQFIVQLGLIVRLDTVGAVDALLTPAQYGAAEEVVLAGAMAVHGGRRDPHFGGYLFHTDRVIPPGTECLSGRASDLRLAVH